ncbi:TIGR03960 family B12-binding radical SAM protein [bacterium]|nr:TIGR03960 family B12-binding radical SAM protein [bacterium]
MNNPYEDILDRVQQPGQYIGGEWNAVVKDHAAVDLTAVLAFPDTYPIGMSHAGAAILYHVLNQRPDVAAERVYMPLPDMQAELRAHGIPLLSLETHRPVREFDVVGFSLQYEMCTTNILAMLDLAGIPLRAADRGDDVPLIVAGGPGAVAPEPVAPFFDLIIPGDGEEVILALADAARDTRGLPRAERLRALAQASPHFYVPSLYEERRDASGRLLGLDPTDGGVPRRITRAFVADLDAAAYPTRPIVPFIETVHDRITLEVMRGCTQGCRFCQAGMIRRPVRPRSVEKMHDIACQSYQATGHNEISLASLSTSDYPDLERLIRTLGETFDARHVSLALSSLRVSDQLEKLPAAFKNIRKSGLTIAPEAASESLRRRINKNISNDDLLRGVRQAYEQGWRAVKLYFMIGLPGETDDDVDAIVALAHEVSAQRGGRGGNVNVAVSSFVPKPHTPFQWEPMDTPEVLLDKQRRIRSLNNRRNVRFRFHNVPRSHIEGVVSRGDRRVADAIEHAWRLGAQLDAWDEHFQYDVWLQALDATDVQPAHYAHRRREEDEWLPWDHIDAGVTRDFLLREKHRGESGEVTLDCRLGACTRCGACVPADKPAP